jgi:hypothetical protein
MSWQRRRFGPSSGPGNAPRSKSVRRWRCGMHWHSRTQSCTSATLGGSPPASRSSLYARFTRRRYAAYRRGACHILRKPGANATSKRGGPCLAYGRCRAWNGLSLTATRSLVHPPEMQPTCPRAHRRSPCLRVGPIVRWRARRDSNPRPPDSKSGATDRHYYAPPATVQQNGVFSTRKPDTSRLAPP